MILVVENSSSLQKKNSKKKGFVRKGGEVSEKDQIGEQLNKSDIRGGKNFFQDLFQVNISQLLSSSCYILSSKSIGFFSIFNLPTIKSITWLT